MCIFYTLSKRKGEKKKGKRSSQEVILREVFKSIRTATLGEANRQFSLMY